MARKIKLAVFGIGVAAMLLGGATPAFAGGCDNPTGNHYGWETCDGCCENPRGNAYGWEDCSSCCREPRGQINGWEDCD